MAEPAEVFSVSKGRLALKKKTGLLLMCALHVAAAAHAEDAPARRAGLWEVVATRTGARPERNLRVCIDKASEAGLNNLDMVTNTGDCEKNDTQLEADAVMIRSVCHFRGSRVVITASIEVKSDAVYTLVANAKYSPPLLGRRQITTRQEANWIGPCPADIRPGDVVSAEGVKTRLYGLSENRAAPADAH